MSIKVIYEDNHLLCVDKPSEVVTQPSKDHEDSLETRAKTYIKESCNKKGDVFLHAVHRLDKEVSGIVIFAKTSKALSRMQQIIRERKMKKIYLAWVEGDFPFWEGECEDYLLKMEHHCIVSTEQNPLAKLARLTYKKKCYENDASLLEIDLDTGRYHQIRAQLSHRGFPIIGDLKYGSKSPFSKQGIMLKHAICSFYHPVKETLIELKAFF